MYGQNSLLERDINNRDSLAGRRHDSTVDRRGSKMFDPKRPKGLAFSMEQALQVDIYAWLFVFICINIILSRIIEFLIYVVTDQEEQKKLEVFAFESERRVASLEETITATLKEKEELISINEGLTSELEGLTEKLNTSTSELYNLKEEISALVSFSVKFFLGFSF